MFPPLVPIAGVTETLLPLLGHVLGRALRARTRPGVLQATRAEEIPRHWVGGVAFDRRRLDHYLRLTDGSDLCRQAGDALPPLFLTARGFGQSLKLLGEPRLDLSPMGLIHVQNDMICRRPIGHTDVVSLALSAERLHHDSDRTLLTMRCDCLVGGRTVVEMRSMLLSGLSPAKAAQEATSTSPPGDGWSDIRRVHLGRRHPLRYALFSGDVNPVHLVDMTSRLFGFPQPIVHGFCLKSLLINALVRHCAKGDLARLRRLRLRFRSPVIPPADLCIQVRDSSVRVISEDGRRLHADGRFNLGPAEIS